MKRKRFVKLLMAMGYSRNEANTRAAIVWLYGPEYKYALNQEKFIKNMKNVFRENQSAIANAILSFLENGHEKN